MIPVALRAPLLQRHGSVAAARGVLPVSVNWRQAPTERPQGRRMSFKIISPAEEQGNDIALPIPPLTGGLFAPVLDARRRALHDLRISVTDRCNFRCTYCMPRSVFNERYSFLPQQELLSFEEIVRLARAFHGHGARKIRLTGGEPLLRHGIETLVEMLRTALPGAELTLTTNGS